MGIIVWDDKEVYFVSTWILTPLWEYGVHFSEHKNVKMDYRKNITHSLTLATETKA